MEEEGARITDEFPAEKEPINKSPIAQKEEEILEFWKKNKIFEKSEENSRGRKEFVFYDGPPFATGTPHYGHILAGTMKDVFPRYQTMKGRHVTRRWGWDCHGLPMENLVEKELGLKTKRDIEKLGIGKFNDVARNGVLRYADDWKKVVPRMGRWVDMEDDYRTMDASYTETVWWIFKNLYDKNLIYKGFKSMHLCPRCGTTLSNFEVNQGYKDTTDISVTVKFELIDEPGTFVLAWTTTPWTLPGNVALAVNLKIKYVKVVFEGDEAMKGKYILAKDRLVALKDKKFQIVEDFSAEKLIGKSYKPLFDYYVNDPKIKNRQNGWKIYAADFVTTEDGTGVVHIAPAFGSDDYELSKKENLPFIQHVNWEGKFKPEVKDFAGQPVKPKDEPQKADVEVLKNLAARGLLFAKEKFTHSYPFCYRCDTPLLNYATSSWFVKVTSIKDQIVEANKKVNWIPEDIRDGRFGNWLLGAPDWAISRSRYWGAPLPVWECEKCEERMIVGSVGDIKKQTRSTNEYFVMRHGEAEHNVKHIVSCKAGNPHHLTDKGRLDAAKTAGLLKDKKIDLIFVSPFVRTEETAEIVKNILGLKQKDVLADDRLHEVNFGDFNLKDDAVVRTGSAYFPKYEDKFVKTAPNGETYNDVRRRVGDFVYDIDKKYQGKKILIITHEVPMKMFVAVSQGWDVKKIVAAKKEKGSYPETASYHKIDFSPLPHNNDYELELHRPQIDGVKFTCKCGGEMKRIPEVFDCWFESGAMPYGQYHYPFENLDKVNPEKGIGFPADFIAEGLDQTRGWFYSLLVLGVALFGKSPYKNVVVNGLILAEDGRKMSKSLKNYPDPMGLVDKYGADSLRFYLLSAPATHAEEMNFSEKGVDEVMKKLVMRLENVYSFYALYTPEKLQVTSYKLQSRSILDRWILARLDKLTEEITTNLDKYQLDRACWPILDFIDDLSTWYLRRSRDRFKSEGEDKNSALATMKYVLTELSKLMAPFMPFIAENIFKKVAGSESVHLENWPKQKGAIGKFFSGDEKLIAQMKEVRKIVALGLEARAKAGIKVRQPLAEIRIKNKELGIKNKMEFLELIKDEVNVRAVIFDETITEHVMLDTNITPELLEEGNVRELTRAVQELRKNMKLNPKDVVALQFETDEAGKAFLEKNRAEIMKAVTASEIKFAPVSVEAVKVGNFSFKISLKKI